MTPSGSKHKGGMEVLWRVVKQAAAAAAAAARARGCWTKTISFVVYFVAFTENEDEGTALGELQKKLRSVQARQLKKASFQPLD